MSTVTANELNSVTAEEIKRGHLDFDLGADEISFPSGEHHMTVMAKLRALAEVGVITWDEVDEIYDGWKD